MESVGVESYAGCEKITSIEVAFDERIFLEVVESQRKQERNPDALTKH